MQKYPFFCARCGVCCILEPCPIAKNTLEFMGLPVPTIGPCIFLCGENKPGDKYTTAKCKLAEMFIDADPDNELKTRKLFGFGSGCCLKANCSKQGGEFEDVAAMAPDMKRTLAAAMINGEVIPLCKTGN